MSYHLIFCFYEATRFICLDIKVGIKLLTVWKKLRMLGCWSSFFCFLGIKIKSSITLPYFLGSQLTDEKVLGNHDNTERREVVSK